MATILIVENMLSISKPENSAELLKKEPFDVISPLRNSIEQLQSLCDSQKASIKIKNTASDPLIEGDPFYWEQIFFKNHLHHHGSSKRFRSSLNWHGCIRISRMGLLEAGSKGFRAISTSQPSSPQPLPDTHICPTS